MIKRIIQTGLLFLFVMYLCCTVDITKGACISAPGPETVVSSEQELQGKLADGFYKYVRGLYDYVDVTRRQLGEETFFEVVYSRLDDFKHQYPDKKILCSVDVGSPLDGVVEVEIEGEFTHYLYVAVEGTVYEFQGKKIFPIAGML